MFWIPLWLSENFRSILRSYAIESRVGIRVTPVSGRDLFYLDPGMFLALLWGSGHRIGRACESGPPISVEAAPTPPKDRAWEPGLLS
jgi:hypothetical protein